VDGTARLQTVSRKVNPLFYALLEQFSKITGVPMLLNTSFNNNFEPIVDSIDDAVACFLTTGLDQLVISDWIVQKQPILDNRALLDFEIKLPATRRLVRRTNAFGSDQFLIECNADKVFVGDDVEISKRLFRALAECDGKTMGVHLKDVGFDDHESDELAAEILSLWEKRAVTVCPLGSPRKV
jgi:carbamoyltransferase